jgi:hypothetical protein
LIDSGVPLMIIQILPRAMWDGSQLLLLGWQVMAEKGGWCSITVIKRETTKNKKVKNEMKKIPQLCLERERVCGSRWEYFKAVANQQPCG